MAHRRTLGGGPGLIKATWAMATPSWNLNRRALLARGSALAAMPVLAAARPLTARLPPTSVADDPGAGWPRHPVLEPEWAHSLVRRLEQKTPSVSARVALSADQWSATPGARVSAAETGSGFALRFESPLRNEAYVVRAREPNGSSSGGASYLVEGEGANYWRRTFSAPQDWSASNRLVAEVFVHDTGLAAYSFGVGFVDEGHAPPAFSDPLPFTFFQDLRAGAWNTLVWEFPELPRGRVVELAFFQPLRGPIGRVTYDLRSLHLQTVEAEKVDGWEVAAGRVAFNHLGYHPRARKVALVSGRGFEEFELLDEASGAVAARFPVARRASRLGEFAALDFSAHRRAGRYRIRAGAIETQPFAIGEELWTGAIEKLLNFFYADRCGHAARGLHGVCHRDLYGEHNGVRKPINGGWHDAGNLSQGSYRTAVCTEGLLALHEGLISQSGQATLAGRVREEASWGLDWMLRARFGGGYRVTELQYAAYTDDRPGSADDMVRPAVFDRFENLLFAKTAADAARALRTVDPPRAGQALQAAIEDYAATLAAPAPAEPRAADRNSAAVFQEYAYGALAGLALHAATGETRYLSDAARFGAQLMACQHRRMVGDSGVTGFFYEDERQLQPSHELHTSFADAAPRALSELCARLPGHGDWAAWRAALTLYSSGFLAKGAEISEPYGHLPNTVWRADQFAAFVERHIAQTRFIPPAFGYKYIPPVDEAAAREGCRREFEAGAPLSDGSRMRTFPIPPDPAFHGATTVQLAMTAGLQAAAKARDDRDLWALAGRQLDWVFGANPFSNCLMFGAGYDYPSQFQAAARNMVGSLPVGMSNRYDRPFWPTATHFTFKEMWVVPAGHMLKVLAGELERWNAPPGRPVAELKATRLPNGLAEIHVDVVAAGAHTLMLWNADLQEGEAADVAGPGSRRCIIRPRAAGEPWVAVVVRRADGRAADCWGAA